MKLVRIHAVQLAVVQALTSSVVMVFNFEQLERRLHRELFDTVTVYGVMSIVTLLLVARLLTSQVRVALVSSALPYVAAVGAFVVVTMPWALGSSNASSNVVSSLVVALFFPYLAIYGPVISLANAVLMLSWIRFVGRRSPPAENQVRGLD